MWGQPPPAVVAASNDAHRCGTPPFENRKGWGSLDIGNAGKEREVERGIVPRFGSLYLECNQEVQGIAQETGIDKFRR